MRKLIRLFRIVFYLFFGPTILLAILSFVNSMFMRNYFGAWLSFSAGLAIRLTCLVFMLLVLLIVFVKEKD